MLAKINGLSLLNNCWYTNADNTQQHLIIKLISALTNYKKESINKDTNSPIAIYKNTGHIIFLNN